MQEARFSSAWPKKDYIAFLGCKLLIYSFALAANDPDADDDSLHTEFSSHWPVQAYLTATSILQTASSMRAEIPFATIYLRRCLVNAVFFLLKLTGYKQHHFVDEVTVRNSINQGWDILKSCSVMENDHMSRVCAVIEYLSNGDWMQGQLQIQSSVSIKARMAANLSVDAVWRARDRFSQSVRDQHPSDYTEAAALERSGTAQGNGFPGHFWSPQLDDVMVDWSSFFEDL